MKKILLCKLHEPVPQVLVEGKSSVKFILNQLENVSEIISN